MQLCSGIISQCRLKFVGIRGMDAFVGYIFPSYKDSIINGLEEMEQECIKANISVYNNLAACILATVKDNSTSNAEKEHEKVVKYTDIVLELDEENDKALYRKAQALKLLRDFSGARETFEKLKSVQAKKGQNVPKDVITGIKDCQEALKDYDRR